MISPNDEQSFNKTAYNNYLLARDLPKLIVDYLFDKSPEFWKLLKYSQNPFEQNELTDKEKKDMICKSSFNTEKYNILFQKYTPDALLEAKSQVRIYVDDITSYGRTNALARVIFQIIVNNHEMILPDTPYSSIDKRDVAIMQTIVETLNGVKLEKTMSQMFINFEVDRFSGAKQVSYNSEYSGFQLTMGVWI